MRVLRGLAIVGIVAAAVVVPAASARAKPRVALRLLPLPKSAIGPAARSLRLQHDSGVLVNGVGNNAGKLVVGSGFTLTPNASFAHALYSGHDLAKVGRISGYALDYGLGASGGTGVTEVRTSVDEYRTPADAKKGLGLWRKTERSVLQYDRGGLSISLRKERAAAVGGSRFAFLVGYAAANIAPLFGLDEQFTAGRYEADVTVWAGTATAAEKLAPRLARKLHARIARALAGRLHARPVKLPRRQKAGRAPDGPDLSQLALQTTDLTGKAAAIANRYWVGHPLSAFAVSEYSVILIPAGEFNSLSQEIQWFATANQASLESDFDAAFFGADPLDLSSLGDGARGVVVNGGSGDGTGYAELVFSSGRLEELLTFSGNDALGASDVETIAEKLASRIDAAGLGTG